MFKSALYVYVLFIGSLSFLRASSDADQMVTGLLLPFSVENVPHIPDRKSTVLKEAFAGDCLYINTYEPVNSTWFNWLWRSKPVEDRRIMYIWKPFDAIAEKEYRVLYKEAEKKFGCPLTFSKKQRESLAEQLPDVDEELDPIIKEREGIERNNKLLKSLTVGAATVSGLTFFRAGRLSVLPVAALVGLNIWYNPSSKVLDLKRKESKIRLKDCVRNMPRE